MSRAARRAVIAEGLKTLKMPSVLRDYEQRARQAQDAQWDYEDYLWQLLEAEIRDREARAVERRPRAARFPDRKTLEQIDFEALQGVSKPNCESWRPATTSTAATMSSWSDPSAPARRISRSRWASRPRSAAAGSGSARPPTSSAT